MNKKLIDVAKDLPSYKYIPDDYWILGLQSKTDLFNQFDDHFYLYKGDQFILGTTGTTNAGLEGLLHYTKYRNDGVAVIKTDEWYYDLWKFGYHRGRMPALKQINPILYYRDFDKDKHVEEMGVLYEGKIGINFHTVTYRGNIPLARKYIGGWSTGCQVVNKVTDYYKIIDRCKNQKTVSYCLIKDIDNGIFI